MTDRDPDTEAIFRSIRAQAQETNRIRVETLDELTADVGDDGLSARIRHRAKDLAHQIAGSAGTFGYLRASDLAREIETILVGDVDAGALADLRKRIEELRGALG
ncbi:MAG TPA: Hpt domain-containing protein [Microlunatus sp.]|nr:Hpt domain-containing protein [Microlunatus sp.]